MRTYNEDLKKKIYLEWGNLLNYNFNDFILEEEQDDDKVDIFWASMKNFEINGIQIFRNVSELALTVLCIPESNVSCERIFSAMNDQKPSKRNKLHFKTMRSLLLTEQYVHDSGGLANFTPTSDMVKKTIDLSKIKEQCINNEENMDSDESDVEIMEYKDICLDEEILEKCRQEDILYRQQRKRKNRKNSINEKPKKKKKLLLDNPETGNFFKNNFLIII